MATHKQDGPDSAWVDGLINRRPYYFRLATYDSASDTLLGHSAPLMTTSDAWPSRVQVVAKGLIPEYFTPPSWSPDGEQLAYVRATEEGPNGYEGNICVFELASGTDRQITFYDGTEHFVGGPAWSSDGAWIAYCYSPTRTAGILDYRIWRTPPSSFTPNSITEGRIDFDPAWGADGDFVFCRGTLGPPNIPELWLASSDSRTARQLTFDQLSRKRHPSVNPRTGMVVFGSEGVNLYDQHLYTIDPNGGSPSQLTSIRYWSEKDPTWTADGNRVIFTSDRSGHSEIWIYETISGEYVQLTRGLEIFPERTAAALSPDGSLIAYREELRYTSRGSLMIAQLEP